MEKEFIPYKQALALKKLGFDELCLGYYLKDNPKLKLGEGINLVTREHRCNVMEYPLHNSNFEYGKNKPMFSYLLTTAPLYQQAFRWFRNKGYNFYITEKYKDLSKFYGGYTRDISGFTGISFGSNYKTYEEAELACLIKLIELCKKV